MNGNTDFNAWLNRFLEEKGLNEEKIYEIEFLGTTHLVERSVVVDTLKNLPHTTQQKFKAKCVELDFRNQNIDRFLEHMAGGVVEARFLRRED